MVVQINVDGSNPNLSETLSIGGRHIILIREATLEDLPELLAIEKESFSSDKLSSRSFRRHIQLEHSDLLVCDVVNDDANPIKDVNLAESESELPRAPKLAAYALIFRHKGTRLARLYSIAVRAEFKGLGLGQLLLEKCEAWAAEKGRIFMRLEVAKQNDAAVALYKKLGYRIFGEYPEYYEDNDDALRMQKKIRRYELEGVSRLTPWFYQTTEFTCGPASLMMAMSSVDNSVICSQALELEIWREATTIFMTSGHGGCHPFGLALAAEKRGFYSEVIVNTDAPLFVDGVRSYAKKNVLTLVHEEFLRECRHHKVSIFYHDVVLENIEAWMRDGFAVLVLISTYRLDGKKAPHWVVVTGIDDVCLYVHDPDVDEKYQEPIDCHYVPIAREDFHKMASFGSNRLRCAVAIRKQK